ncbi:MAG: hypothetical protein WAU31_02525 [Candidatus Moraniibacteriota bacterium]
MLENVETTLVSTVALLVYCTNMVPAEQEKSAVFVPGVLDQTVKQVEEQDYAKRKKDVVPRLRMTLALEKTARKERQIFLILHAAL